MWLAQFMKAQVQVLHLRELLVPKASVYTALMFQAEINFSISPTVVLLSEANRTLRVLGCVGRRGQRGMKKVRGLESKHKKKSREKESVSSS